MNNGYNPYGQMVIKPNSDFISINLNSTTTKTTELSFMKFLL